MSYYTRLEFHFDGDPPPFAVVVECARAYFDADRYAVDDLIVALQLGWEDGATEVNRLECSDIEGLMCRISQRFPDLRMCVRANGEEWRDLWLREFAAGKVVFSGGPFLDGKRPAFFRAYFGE